MDGSFRNSKLHIFSSSATPDIRFTSGKSTEERLSGKFSTSDGVDRLTFTQPEENPVKFVVPANLPGRKRIYPATVGSSNTIAHRRTAPVNPITSRYSSASLKTAAATTSASTGEALPARRDRRGVTGESRIRKKTVRAAPLHKNSHPLFRRWLFRIAGRRYTSPEKPMKAMARIPAVISAIGTPLNALGTSSNSSLSRMPAKSTSARANPNAVATE